MRNFRLLRADEIECRIAQTTAKGVQLLLYKTARTDYAVLDETYGCMNWQNSYKEVDGKVYCSIGIYSAERGEWVWKENCGSESNMEAEKGEASDAMKRAGFAWGIGTELYSSPFIWIPSDRCKIVTENDGKPCKPFCRDRFTVMNIGYDENERINALDIDNATMHKSAFHMGGAPAQETPIETLRKQIIALAEAKGIDAQLVTGAEYGSGKTFMELNETDLRTVKMGLAKR